MGKKRRPHKRRPQPAPVPPSPTPQPPPVFGKLAALGEVPAVPLTLLCLLVVGSYLPAMWAGFVWDDATITSSRAIAAADGIWDIWFSPGTLHKEAHYWPVVYTSFWLEHKLWGFAPAGYHIVNVLLHAANTLLLFRLLVRLRAPAAWVVAAVFAVHPTHVESVVWVIERKDVLSGLFYLCAVSAYLRFNETGGRRFYGLSLLCFVLGLLSKSIVVTLPAALLIGHWWQRGRVTTGELRATLPFFALGFGITMADLWLARAVEPIVSTFTLEDRILMASRALWFYVGQLVWPTDLAVIYDVSAGQRVHAAAWAALLTALWLLRRRIGRGPLAGVLFFMVTISPVLGFVDYGYMRFSMVADRFQYLAGIGVLAVLVGAVARGTQKLPAQPGVWVATAALLVVLGTATWQHAQIYRNTETFFTHIIAHNPNAEGAHRNLASEYRRQGQMEPALATYRIALEKKPNSHYLHNDIGLTLLDLGRLDQAEQSIRRALEINPHYAKGLNNLAVLRMRQRQYRDAVELYQAAIAAEPGLAAAHSGLGGALVKLGQPEEALRSFERALALQPGLQHALDHIQQLRGR